jgi:hypothetical protein
MHGKGGITMADTINLFISHYGGDEGYVEKFKKLIDRHYDVRDSSVVESDPNKATSEEYIKTLLKAQMDWAGKVVVLIGPITHEREWVNWEIEYAATHGDKQIIGVYLPGASNSDVPDALNKLGDDLVTWNQEKIISALEGDGYFWEDADGKPRPDAETRGVCY